MIISHEKASRVSARVRSLVMIYFIIRLDKCMILFQNGDCSLKGFLSIVGDTVAINEREIRKFEEGINGKRHLTRC